MRRYRLEILNLESIYMGFDEEHVASMVNALLAGCPKLKDLEMCRFDMKGGHHLSRITSLSRLSVVDVVNSPDVVPLLIVQLAPLKNLECLVVLADALPSSEETEDATSATQGECRDADSQLWRLIGASCTKLKSVNLDMIGMATQVAAHNDFEMPPVCPIRFQGDVSYLGHFDSLSKLELVGDFLPPKLTGLEKLSGLRHLMIEVYPQSSDVVSLKVSPSP